MTEKNIDLDVEIKKVEDQLKLLTEEKGDILQQRAALDRKLNDLHVQMVGLQGSLKTLGTIAGKDLEGSPLGQSEKPKKDTPIKKKK